MKENRPLLPRTFERILGKLSDEDQSNMDRSWSPMSAGGNYSLNIQTKEDGVKSAKRGRSKATQSVTRKDSASAVRRREKHHHHNYRFL